MYRQTDICNSRVAFATENLKSKRSETKVIMDQINHLRDQEIGMMADMHEFERLRGFGDGRTDRQMDICDCRVAFATENIHLYLETIKVYSKPSEHQHSKILCSL